MAGSSPGDALARRGCAARRPFNRVAGYRVSFRTASSRSPARLRVRFRCSAGIPCGPSPATSRHMERVGRSGRRLGRMDFQPLVVLLQMWRSQRTEAVLPEKAHRQPARRWVQAPAHKSGCRGSQFWCRPTGSILLWTRPGAGVFRIVLGFRYSCPYTRWLMRKQS